MTGAADAHFFVADGNLAVITADLFVMAGGDATDPAKVGQAETLFNHAPGQTSEIDVFKIVDRPQPGKRYV